MTRARALLLSTALAAAFTLTGALPATAATHSPDNWEDLRDTIASADEEGDRVFENASDDRSSNVSPDERHALERTDYMPTRDEDRLQQASMDNVDFDGEPLNEAGFGEGRGDTVAPNDLDTNVEGADEPDGDVTDFDDEENKTYSIGSGDNDNVTEGTP